MLSIQDAQQSIDEQHQGSGGYGAHNVSFSATEPLPPVQIHKVPSAADRNDILRQTTPPMSQRAPYPGPWRGKSVGTTGAGSLTGTDEAISPSAKTLVPMNPEGDEMRVPPEKVDRAALISLMPVGVHKYLDGVVGPQDIEQMNEEFAFPAIRHSPAQKKYDRIKHTRESARGSTVARFHFPQRSVSSFGRLKKVGPALKCEHYDVMVDWDYDSVNLNSDYGVWSPDFVRSFFSYETDPEPKVLSPNQKSLVQSLQSGKGRALEGHEGPFEEQRNALWAHWAPAPLDEVDSMELLTWVRQLRPRTVHDVKPLFMLVQCLLGDVLHNRLKVHVKGAEEQQRQYETVIKEIKTALQSEIDELQDTLMKREEEIGELRSKLGHNIQMKTSNAARAMFANIKHQKAVAVGQKEHVKHQSQVMGAIEETKLKEMQIADLTAELEEMKAKNAAEQKERMRAQMQAEELQKKMNKLNAETEELEHALQEQLQKNKTARSGTVTERPPSMAAVVADNLKNKDAISMANDVDSMSKQDAAATLAALTGDGGGAGAMDEATKSGGSTERKGKMGNLTNLSSLKVTSAQPWGAANAPLVGFGGAGDGQGSARGAGGAGMGGVGAGGEGGADNIGQNAELVAALLGKMNTDEAAGVISKMTDEQLGKVVEKLDDDTITSLLCSMSMEDASRMLAQMDEWRASVVLSIDPMDPAKAAALLNQMTPPKAARVIKELDADVAGQVCRELSVDFTSSMFTCDVLKADEVSKHLIKMKDTDHAGTVVFTMKRKVNPVFIAQVLSYLTTQEEGELVGAMMGQARKRMEFSELTSDRLTALCTAMGEMSGEVLECQNPETVALMLQNNFDLNAAVDILQSMSGDARSNVLLQGKCSPEWVEKVNAIMNPESSGGSDATGGDSVPFVCPKCGFSGHRLAFSMSSDAPPEQKAAMLAHMDPEHGAALLKQMMEDGTPVQEIAQMLLLMDPPDEGFNAAELLQCMCPEEKDKVQDLQVAMTEIDAPHADVIFSLVKMDGGKKRGGTWAKEGKQPDFDQDFMENVNLLTTPVDMANLPSITPPNSWLDYLAVWGLPRGAAAVWGLPRGDAAVWGLPRGAAAVWGLPRGAAAV
ncbi:hypothetical protein CYMTET_49791, partial [Cymbomonas tetramitiformis]